MVLGKKLEVADDNSWVVLVEEELAGSYTVPVDDDAFDDADADDTAVAAADDTLSLIHI